MPPLSPTCTATAGTRTDRKTERNDIQETLARCLPRRVEPYLFDGGELRNGPFDFSSLRELVLENLEDLTGHAVRVFEQGCGPTPMPTVTTPAALRAHVEDFAENLETVVARLRRRLGWAMDQIKRLNELRERKGTLQPDEEALFRRCDGFIKRLKGADRRRSHAEGHDDSNTFNVLAAEGFLARLRP